jgi:hypothetical protein
MAIERLDFMIDISLARQASIELKKALGLVFLQFDSNR